MNKVLASALLALTLTGCSIYREATSTTAFTSDNWREIATDNDRDRLRDWRKAWTEALPLAKAADPQAIARDPLLFDPDRAFADATIPPGDYRCRVYKLGATGSGLGDFTTYPAFTCVVQKEGDLIRFHKLTGLQRPTGLLFADIPARQVFLGTLILGDETAALRYGLDGMRDVVGYVEKIGDHRWRLVLPWPRFESKLDVIELIPDT